MTVRDLFRRTQVRPAVAFTLIITIAVSAIFATLIVRLAAGLEESAHARVLVPATPCSPSIAVMDLTSLSASSPTKPVRPRHRQHLCRRRCQRHLRRRQHPHRSRSRVGACSSATACPTSPPTAPATILLCRMDTRLARHAADRPFRPRGATGCGILMRSLAGACSPPPSSVGSGIYLARGAQRHIDDIANTLSAVSPGGSTGVCREVPHHDSTRSASASTPC